MRAGKENFIPQGIKIFYSSFCKFKIDTIASQNCRVKHLACYAFLPCFTLKESSIATEISLLVSPITYTPKLDKQVRMSLFIKKHHNNLMNFVPSLIISFLFCSSNFSTWRYDSSLFNLTLRSKFSVWHIC